MGFLNNILNALRLVVLSRSDTLFNSQPDVTPVYFILSLHDTLLGGIDGLYIGLWMCSGNIWP